MLREHNLLFLVLNHTKTIRDTVHNRQLTIIIMNLPIKPFRSSTLTKHEPISLPEIPTGR